MRRFLAVSALFVAGLPGLIATAPGAAAISTHTSYAVAYQINQAHSGLQQDDFLRPPLAQRWSHTFPSSSSYPLIAGGKVFVTVRNVSQYGTTLYALDEATGATAWSRPIPGTYYWSNAAYEGGRVFVVNFDGVLQAFSATDGTTVWTRQLPGQYAFSSPPVVSGGVIYVGGAGSGGTLYAVSSATGNVLWTRSVENGDDSSPALSPTSVFVSYAGPQVYAFRRSNGDQLWHYDSGIEGGGGKTPVFVPGDATAPGGRLYTRAFEGSYVFDALTGEILDTFGSATAPAFANGTGLFLYDGVLEARDVDSGSLLWSFNGGGSQLSSAPIVVKSRAGTYVYEGSSGGMLYALDLTDGAVAWSANVGAGIPAPDEQNVSQPLTGLAAGEGLLVVPAGNLLVAYGD
jgi:outer membrane protein assembly factor BamB